MPEQLLESERLPPLRERPDGISPLVAGFLRELAGDQADLTPEAMEALRRHEWPGGVRELRNVLDSNSTDLGTLEKKAIERAMREADGNKVRAARHLGISRMQLHTRLRKFEFDSR